MNIHEFGCEHERNLVLIHGACMSWDMFQEAIDLLQNSFHVYVPAIPGHDLTIEDEFTSLESIAAELEEELISRGAEEIELLYGLSMGGGFVIRMLADNRLRVRHAVIDAGIAPYELPRICTRFILAKDVLMTALGKYSRAALETAFPKARYGSAADRMWQVLQHMTMRSIRNVYDSTDNYAMPAVFPDIDTKIEYWYGSLEKKEREPDITYVRKHIPGVVFREMAGMGHGEYAAAHAEELADDLIRIAEDEQEVYPMRPEYKNWVPKGMIYALGAGTAVLGAGALAAESVLKDRPELLRKGAKYCLGAAAAGCGAAMAWSVMAHRRFSYDGKRRLSADIIEKTAAYITLPEGGRGLDVGCGSGALTIACAKNNPQGTMVGLDRWGPEYASYSKSLCEANAEAEGIANVSFMRGDAIALDFADETFDAVTSNYVYHNITGHDRQQLLRESLRVLKKGGTFAIHDIMSRSKYSDMEKFVQELKDEGYADVRLIPTAGLFMSRAESVVMLLQDSYLLTSKK